MYKNLICFYQVRPYLFLKIVTIRKDCQLSPFLAGWQVIRVLAEKGLEVQKRNDRGDCPLICATWKKFNSWKAAKAGRSEKDKITFQIFPT